MPSLGSSACTVHGMAKLTCPVSAPGHETGQTANEFHTLHSAWHTQVVVVSVYLSLQKKCTAHLVLGSEKPEGQT
jgi:hypothetical protein